MSHLDTLKKMQEEQNGIEPAKTNVPLPGGVVITDDTELVKDVPPQMEENVQEKADLVVTSKIDLEAIIKDIVKAYDVKIEAADNRIDQLALIIEMQQKTKEVTAPKRPGVKVSPRSHNVPDHMSILADANKDKLKGKIGRFVSNRSDMRSLRRFQGYEPVLDENGKEVRYMDGVLMGVQKQRHEEEIRKPREEKKQFRAKSVGARFEEDAAKAGVEVIGEGIEYDVNYDTPSKK